MLHTVGKSQKHFFLMNEGKEPKHYFKNTSVLNLNGRGLFTLSLVFLLLLDEPLLCNINMDILEKIIFSTFKHSLRN